MIWFDRIKHETMSYRRLYNEQGTLLPLKYTGIKTVSNGLVAYEVADKWGYLNSNGECVLEPIWQEVSDFNDDGYAIVEFRESEKVAVIDKKGSYVLSPRDYAYIDFLAHDLLLVGKNRKQGVITVKGREIVPIQFDEVEIVDNFYKVKIGKKYGLLDANGKTIFECIYPEIIETPDKLVVQDFARQEVAKQKDVSKAN